MNKKSHDLSEPASVLGRVLDFLYPPRCPLCGMLTEGGQAWHPECVRRLPAIRGSRCAVCGKPVRDGETVCDDCEDGHHVFASGRGVIRYDGQIRSVLYGFKYLRKRQYGALLGELLVKGGAGYLEAWRPDYLVPVPVHPKREKERGYNQAEVLARIVSNKTGIPVLPGLVRRRVATGAMKELNAEERRKALADVFYAAGRLPEGASVCIIDDIYTTGATADAVSRVLLGAGAARVHFLTVCIGGGFVVSY